MQGTLLALPTYMTCRAVRSTCMHDACKRQSQTGTDQRPTHWSWWLSWLWGIIGGGGSAATVACSAGLRGTACGNGTATRHACVSDGAAATWLSCNRFCSERPWERPGNVIAWLPVQPPPPPRTLLTHKRTAPSGTCPHHCGRQAVDEKLTSQLPDGSVARRSAWMGPMISVKVLPVGVHAEAQHSTVVVDILGKSGSPHRGRGACQCICVRARACEQCRGRMDTCCVVTLGPRAVQGGTSK